MPYDFYRLMHFLGIFVMLAVLSYSCAHATRDAARSDRGTRRALGAIHGVASLMVLTGGFGMLARLGILHDGLPGWVLVKLGIWFLLAVAIALPYRHRRFATLLPLALPFAALGAAAAALYKPFTGG
jgi:hypothetical protein